MIDTNLGNFKFNFELDWKINPITYKYAKKENSGC